jgi:hypothetical protein
MAHRRTQDRFHDAAGLAWKWTRRGYVAIGAGQVVEASWEEFGLSHQRCCNLPIQGIAADCMLRALKWVYVEFRACRIRGGLIATVHDELIAEVAEDDAEGARDLLDACMLAGFAETFPNASSRRRGRGKIRQNLGRAEIAAPAK